jgi:transposase InsO family protein
LSASPGFIVIKAADAFKHKTTAPNQLCQTDFTYLKVIGWGWFYLSTVLDDFSPTLWRGSCAPACRRKMLPTPSTWHCGQRPGSGQASRSTTAAVRQWFHSTLLAKWLNDRNIKHLRGAPYHPMTYGKIER